MKTIFALLVLSSLAVASVQAEQPAASAASVQAEQPAAPAASVQAEQPAAPAASVQAEQPAAPAIELKNKSSFTMDASGRNPFWPIGWKPVARTQTTTEHSGPDILPSAFVVSSITLDPGARFAIINGKVMQEGQQFGLQLGNQTYQLTVKAIQDGQVILARRDQEIVVPLRRK